jgi:hypothetical protein
MAGAMYFTRSSVPALVHGDEWLIADTSDKSEMQIHDPAAYPDFSPYDREEALPSGRGRVRIGGNQRVSADELVREMVTIFGNSELKGRSAREMVTVYGNATMTGSVGREMVTVFGNATMTGRVGREMVTVFGNAEVDGPIERDLVVVFGNLRLGPNAVVNRDCVVVFGRLERDPGSVIHRGTVEVIPWFSGIGDYLRSGPLMGRLLPPQSILAWVVVAIHFIAYFLIALILPKPTAAGVGRIEKNPFLCFGVGVLAMILMAPAAMILGVTVIGILLIPFLWLSEIALAILGKTSVLQVIGLQILRRFSSDADNRPISAFFIGFLLLTAIYMIPILGLLVWILLRPLSIGAAILAVFGELKKNGNGTDAPGIPVCPASMDAVPPGSVPVNSTTDTGIPAGEQSTASSAEIHMKSGMSGEFEVTVMPRSGFWIRTGATALDFVLLGWVLSFSGPFFMLFWLAYHVAMWTWKGTTIGGIILRLKVVRLDGRPISFDVALIRGLTAVISAAALFIGFFWAGWSRDRQSWHDIITDTVIVRSPRSLI